MAVDTDVPFLTDSPTAGGEVAVLDRQGVIVAVNEAWREFALRNGGDPDRTGVGASYLDACSGSDDPATERIATAIRAAVAGSLTAPVMITIRCDAPGTPRTFDVFVSSRLADDGSCQGATVTLAHRPPGAIPAAPSGWGTSDDRPSDSERRVADVLHICASIIADPAVPTVIRRTVAAARELTQARYAALGVTDESGTVIEFAHDDPGNLVRDEQSGVSHAQVMVAMVADTAQPLRLMHISDHPAADPVDVAPASLDSLLAVGLRRAGQPYGVLYLANSQWGEFDAEDEQSIIALAAFAGEAIEQALWRRGQQEGQRRDPSLFVAASTLQQRIVEIFDEALAATGLSGSVYFADLADRFVPTPLTDDLETVIRQGMAILAEHAEAEMIVLGLSLTDEMLTLDLIDDGRGPDDAEQPGIDALRRRAQAHGGTLDFATGASRGTFLRWSAPLRREDR